MKNLITLENEKSQKEGCFRQQVVIRANTFPEGLDGKLKSLSDWLGIGVKYALGNIKTELHGSTPVKFLGNCRASTTSGIVGGAISTWDDRILQVTCNHVIPEDCDFVFKRFSIDLALIESKSCFSNNTICFLYLGHNSNKYRTSSVVAAAQNDLKLIQGESSVCIKKHPKVNKIGGLITACDANPSIGGIEYRNHILIEPYSKSTILSLIYRIFDVGFSKQGDSGSWVFDESGKWIGMVIGRARGSSRSSIVLPAAIIKKYLEETDPRLIRDTISWH